MSASVFDPPVVRVPTNGGANTEALIEREWIVTNGIGGYSSGTVSGVITRRYHGLLVAALPNPLGRMVMLNNVLESLDARKLRAFELDAGMPVWSYDIGGATLRKRLVMPHRQNTIVIEYSATGHGSIPLRLAPAVHFRNYEAPVSQPLQDGYKFAFTGDYYELSVPGLPCVRVSTEGQLQFVLGEERYHELSFKVEEARGFRDRGTLWSPGAFIGELKAGESVTLSASTEEMETVRATWGSEAFELERERKRRLIAMASREISMDEDATRQLVIAADQFIIKPVGRVRDSVRATAVGDELRTIIAGYHWFTDWGRDTMISLEGLTLTTGRHREAGFVLRTFAQYVRDGLIPNLFPDGSDEGLYHTADATLWFFHAVDRYVRVTGDESLVRRVLPIARGIVEAHLRGTRFGIGMDPQDHLLRQGAEGYQLTWMDAKVDGWVVTPRRGKAVEINALWFNALCVLGRWESEHGDRDRSGQYSEEAKHVRESFNRRFWNAQRGYLYDVVDGPSGDDDACRPNQIFSIALPNAVLDETRWRDVLSVVREKLLTPVGLRSLSPDHPDFKARYFGDLRARDAAYHQGTVWAWLIGPWVDAWLKVHPDDVATARGFLDGLIGHLPDFGVGSIAEIFDAEPPYTARGCVAQAWSVAEVLRCLAKIEGLRNKD